MQPFFNLLKEVYKPFLLLYHIQIILSRYSPIFRENNFVNLNNEVPQNGVKSKQVKKSATTRTIGVKHMGNPYLFLSKEKELRFSRLSSYFNCEIARFCEFYYLSILLVYDTILCKQSCVFLQSKK